MPSKRSSRPASSVLSVRSGSSSLVRPRRIRVSTSPSRDRVSCASRSSPSLSRRVNRASPPVSPVD
eukprot:5336447-Alexandrium_andersonii.AAC.1